MAKDENIVILSGRLGKDPDLKYTTNGQPYAIISLATGTESRKKDDGTWDNISQWHRVVIWGPDATRVAQDAAKGDRVRVEGLITYREWDDAQGNRQRITEIKANMIKTWPKDGSARPSDAGRQQAAGQASNIPALGDENIPF